MIRTSTIRRRAFSLLELIASTAIMATLTTSSFVLVRTAHNAWLRHRDDAEQRQAALGALQHIMRRVRQATSVLAISTAADAAGSLTINMSDGTTSVWSRNNGTNQVLYGTSSANNLLAAGITETTFVGYKADGSTATTQVDAIHAVKCTMKYNLTRPSGTTNETVSCMAWLRSW